MSPQPMRTGAAYIRVSTDEQADQSPFDRRVSENPTLGKR